MPHNKSINDARQGYPCALITRIYIMRMRPHRHHPFDHSKMPHHFLALASLTSVATRAIYFSTSNFLLHPA